MWQAAAQEPTLAEPRCGRDDEVFVAIDFETANDSPESACALGLVRVERGEVVEERTWLIRPPEARFRFTYVHGIAWPDVRGAPLFAEVWAEARSVVGGADYLAAHNADFDRSVLVACCRAARMEVPALPFVCTVAISRRTWRLENHQLPTVCRHLKIPLDHHEAGSDAMACAQVVLHAKRLQQGAGHHQ